MKRTFLEALDERVLVCDGAMGTMLYARGVFINRSFDALNLTQPDLVGEVHREYLRAGADVIETNTFGANRVKLAAFGLGDSLHEINVARAPQIARGAARERGVGGRRHRPAGHPHRAVGAARASTRPRTLLPRAGRGAARGRRRSVHPRDVPRRQRDRRRDRGGALAVPTCPIVAQMTTEEDGNSLDGTPPEEFGPAARGTRRDVIGVNCSVGPAPMLETIERMARRDHAAAVGAAQRRPAARHRGPQHLSVLARIHGVLRPPVHSARRAAGGRVLRHHARAHPADPASPCSAQAPGAAAGRRVGRRDRHRRASSVAAGRRAPTSRALARALAEGRCVVTVEVEPPRGRGRRPRCSPGRAVRRAAASTRSRCRKAPRAARA